MSLSVAGDWNQMVLNVPSSPNHGTILWKQARGDKADWAVPLILCHLCYQNSNAGSLLQAHLTPSALLKSLGSHHIINQTELEHTDVHMYSRLTVSTKVTTWFGLRNALTALIISPDQERTPRALKNLQFSPCSPAQGMILVPCQMNGIVSMICKWLTQVSCYGHLSFMTWK